MLTLVLEPGAQWEPRAALELLAQLTEEWCALGAPPKNKHITLWVKQQLADDKHAFCVHN